MHNTKIMIYSIPIAKESRSLLVEKYKISIIAKSIKLIQINGTSFLIELLGRTI